MKPFSRMSIRAQLALICIVFSILPLLMLGHVLYRSFRAGILTSTERNLESLVDVAMKQIDNYTIHNLELMEYLSSSSHTASQAVHTLDGEREAEGREGLRNIFMMAMPSDGDIDVLFFLHPESGRVLASSDEAQVGKIFSKKPYFSMGKDEVTVYRVHYSHALEKSIMALSTPVREEGRLLGVIVAWMNIDRMIEFIKIPSTASFNLVNRANLHVAMSDEGAGQLPILSGIFSEGAVRGLEGEKGSGIYTDHRGRQVVGAYGLVESWDMALLAEIPLQLVLAEANRVRTRVFVSATLLALAVITIVLILGRRITDPLYRLAHSMTAYGRSGTETLLQPVGTSPEISALTESFNRMTSLRGAAEEELQWDRDLKAALSSLYRPLISHSSTLEEIAGAVLEKAKELSRSEHGYVSIIDQETGENVAYNLTAMMENECRVAGEKRRVAFPRGADGTYPTLWGHALNSRESFFTNSPREHPASTGLPEGHIAMRNFLSVPVIDGDEIVGQIALANAFPHFSSRVLEAMESLAEFYALAVRRKRAEEALEEAKAKIELQYEELRELDRMKDSLIIDVSHELKTPVAKHAMHLEILRKMLERSDLRDSTHDILATMDHGVHRQQNTINNILMMSRLEVGERRFRREPVRLDGVLDEVLADYAHAIAQFGIELKVDLPPVMVMSDGEMLRHVFSNIINNSIKYRSPSRPMLDIRTVASDGHAVVRIEDNGVGLTGEEREKAFERFYQSSASKEGIGAGLTIVRMIVSKLEGEVHLDSEGRDRGTTAVVTLPLSRDT